jgi:hypothetical protein
MNAPEARVPEACPGVRPEGGGPTDERPDSAIVHDVAG